MRRKAYIYRLYSSSQELLYIGMTFNVKRRLKGHESKPWFPDVACYTVQRFKNRYVAWAAEALAIYDEQPIHNVNYKNPADLEWLERLRK